MKDYKEYYIVTHTDLDGAGTPIVMQNVLPLRSCVTTYYWNNDELNNNLKTLIRTIEKNKNILLIIADHSPSKEVYNMIKDRIPNYLIFDHHKSSQLIDIYDKNVIIDIESCATKLVYNYAIKHFDIKEKVKKTIFDFVTLVNDYDLWIHKHPKSKELNIILGELGIVQFVKRFSVNINIEFDKLEKTIVSIAKQRRSLHIDHIVNSAAIFNRSSYRYAITFCNDVSETSEGGNAVLERRNVDFVFVINPWYQKVSVRSKEGFDASVIASNIAKELLTNSGGHARAAGFSYENFELDNLWSALISYEHLLVAV